MAYDYTSTEMSAYTERQRKGEGPAPRQRPHFAEKSYDQRAREAYLCYLDSLSQNT